MPTIYDHRGNPVEPRKLQQEIATAHVSTVRSIWYDSVATGLTPANLANILTSVDQGDAIGYLTLAEEMEEREMHYSSVLGTRKRAIEKLKVQIEAVSDDTRDVEYADFVREVLSGPSARELIAQQMDAVGKGFSASEIHWDKSGKQWEPSGFTWRDGRYFVHSRTDGETLRLRDESNVIDGVELPAYKFIIHKPRLKMGLSIRGGLARLASVAFMCKGYTLKDWLAFMEVFGMPIRVGKYGQTATPEQKSKLLTAVSNIGSDAACIIPDSMMLEIVQNKSASGDKVFEGLANYLDAQVSKAVLGQTMTTDDGSSLSQAKVHNEVREDIKESDAFKLANTLRRDLVKPLIDLNFRVLHPREYPILSLVEEHPEDLKLLSEALPPFIDRGLTVETSVIRDKFGLPEPEEGAEVLKAKSSGVAPQPATEGEEEEENQDNPPPSNDDDDDDEEQQAEAAARRKTLVALLNRVEAGEELSEDERKLLLALAQTTEPEEDRIARQAVEDWSYMDPVLTPIIELAQSATSFAEVQAKLDDLPGDIKVKRLAASIALATFKARGVGDATDRVSI